VWGPPLTIIETWTRAVFKDDKKKRSRNTGPFIATDLGVQAREDFTGAPAVEAVALKHGGGLR